MERRKKKNKESKRNEIKGREKETKKKIFILSRATVTRRNVLK